MSFWFRTGLFVFSLNLFGWFPQGLQAETLIISHPDDSSKTVEAFFKKPPKPKQNGSWPTVVFLHGYQSQPSAGGKDFMAWGVLDKFADRGILPYQFHNRDLEILPGRRIFVVHRPNVRF